MALTPPKFDYIRPDSVDKAIELLSDNMGNAKLLGGGQSLIPLLKTRILTLEKLIDIGNMASLNHIGRRDSGFSIGSTTRINQLEGSQLVREELKMLHEASEQIADPLVRNMGTAGGNVSHADPGNDLPVVMLAYGASFTLQGKTGERRIKADDYFVGPFETAAKENEVMTEILIPSPVKGEGSSFMKVKRTSGDFSVATSSSRIRVGEDLRITDARIVVGSATPAPSRLKSIEEMLVDRRIDAATLTEIRKLATEGLDIMDDATVSRDYRLFSVSNAVARSVEVSYGRATGR